MRIDLPLCDFINCRYRFDGNCKDGNEYNRCQYNRLKEQESILDKIRAEIEFFADADAYGDYQQGFSDGLMRAVQIIDKYKAESEDKE